MKRRKGESENWKGEKEGSNSNMESLQECTCVISSLYPALLQHPIKTSDKKSN